MRPSSTSIVVSYCTPAYRREALELERTLQTFSVPHIITEIEDRGTWERNCAWKPTFILNQMIAHDCPIVWLDADARVKAPLALFDEMQDDVDVACHFRHGVELLTGTIYFADTPDAIELLRLWKEECEAHPTAWDQVCLANVLKRENRFTVEPLPASYCAIFDDPKMMIDPVIVHGQASRRLKQCASRS